MVFSASIISLINYIKTVRYYLQKIYKIHWNLSHYVINFISVENFLTLCYNVKVTYYKT